MTQIHKQFLFTTSLKNKQWLNPYYWKNGLGSEYHLICLNKSLTYQPKSSGDMWMEHGLQESGEVRSQAWFNLFCSLNCILPCFIRSIKSAQQVSWLIAPTSESHNSHNINKLQKNTQSFIDYWKIERWGTHQPYGPPPQRFKWYLPRIKKLSDEHLDNVKLCLSIHSNSKHYQNQFKKQ